MKNLLIPAAKCQRTTNTKDQKMNRKKIPNGLKTTKNIQNNSMRISDKPVGFQTRPEEDSSSLKLWDKTGRLKVNE